MEGFWERGLGGPGGAPQRRGNGGGNKAEGREDLEGEMGAGYIGGVEWGEIFPGETLDIG